MKTKLVVLFALILAFASTIAVIDTTKPTNAYCTSQGKTSWKFNKLTQSTTPASFEFDEASAFKDLTTGDSVPIMVRKPTSTAPFTFITLDKKTLEQTEKTCKGTTTSDGYEFVQFTNQFLFLKKSGEYYFCVYDVKDPSTQFNPIKVDKPVNTLISGAITSFASLKLTLSGEDSFNIKILWGDGTKKALLTYTLTFPATRVSGTYTLTPFQPSVTINDASTQMIGTESYLYSATQHKILYLGTNWGVYSATSIVYPTDPLNFKGYKFYAGSAILNLYNTTTSSKLYWLGPNGISQITWTSATVSNYVYYYDGLSNFWMSGSDKTLWVTLSQSTLQLMQTEIPAEELAVTSDEILDVALSGNVATIFYGTKIRYLKHVDSGEVDQLFDKSIASTDIDYSEANYEINIKFSCICASLKKFACFSSTLNCLIVKKGGATCSSQGSYPFIEVSG